MIQIIIQHDFTGFRRFHLKLKISLNKHQMTWNVIDSHMAQNAIFHQSKNILYMLKHSTEQKKTLS